MVFHIDFNELHSKACALVSSPGDAGSDYERWTPSDGRLGDKCLLGRKVEYTRRKREATCFIPEEVTRKTFVQNCACAETDFECDVNYVRKQEGGPCVVQANLNVTANVPEVCPSGSFYGISNGYRKVVGDSCEGGVDRNPSMYPCPHWASRVSHGGWVVLFVIMALVVALGLSTYKSKKGVQGRMEQGAAILSCCRERMSMEKIRYDVLGAGAAPESAVDYEHYATDDHDMEDGFGLDDDEDDDDEPTLMDKHNAKPQVRIPWVNDGNESRE